MKELKRWKNAGDNYGYRGLIFWLERAGSNNIYPEFRRMKEQGPDASYSGYNWDEDITHNLPEGTDWTQASYMPSGDFVEMDDGSIIIALFGFSTKTINFYRSFDCGENWTYVYGFSLTYTGRNNIALDRIGNRLILVYA